MSKVTETEKAVNEVTEEATPVENVLERKNPLWAFGNNRIEIRNIAEMAGESLETVLPEIDFRTHCVAIPCTVLCFMNELLNRLNTIKIETKKPVPFQFGNLMTLEIEQLEIADAEKSGSLNPAIYPGEELDYDKRDIVPSDAVSSDMAKELAKIGGPDLPAQFYGDREFYKKISETCMQELDKEYGVVFFNWSIIPLITLHFFRAAKRFLIENKDNEETGIAIDFANILTIGISKEGPDDDVSYAIYLEPGQIFKKDYGKSDAITEEYSN